MRTPRLEVVFSLSVLLVMAFTIIYILLYIMAHLLVGEGFEGAGYGPMDRTILCFTSMIGAGFVVHSASIFAISEQQKPQK